MQSDGQRSLRDYFTNEKQRMIISPYHRGSLHSPSGSKRTLSDDEPEPLSSTPAKKKPSVIVIDSDIDEDEENVFQHSTKYRNTSFVNSPLSRSVLGGQNRQRLTSASGKKKTTRSRPGKWSCSSCTYSNHSLMSYCEMCSAKRDSQSGCTESPVVVHSDHVASSSEVPVCSLASGSCDDISETPSVGQNSPSSSSQENWSDVLNCSDVIEMLTMSPVNKPSNGTSPNSSDCLKILSMDSKHPTDVNSVEDSRADEDLDSDVTGAQLPIDFRGMTVHELFQFCCSRHSSRIYVYDKEGIPFNINFSPVDLQLENYADMPHLLLHPRHLQLLKRFLREWNSLSSTKQRLIVRSGSKFTSPVLCYEQLKSLGRTTSQQRYTSKADLAGRAMSKAQEVGGFVRVISRSDGGHVGAEVGSVLRDMDNDGTASVEEIMESLSGFVQALDANGTPLCLHCQCPYQSALIDKTTVEQNPWLTRLCSRQCMQQFWISQHRDYSAKQVYEAEHGVCQLCQFDAESFYKRLRSTTNLNKRVELVESSVYKSLKAEVKEKMIRQPYTGLFWNVDHIVPVAEGGGTCDVDNLRTLCTVCHRQVTAEQHRDRARRRLVQSAANCRDISAFFHPVV